MKIKDVSEFASDHLTNTDFIKFHLNIDFQEAIIIHFKKEL